MSQTAEQKAAAEKAKADKTAADKAISDQKAAEEAAQKDAAEQKAAAEKAKAEEEAANDAPGAKAIVFLRSHPAYAYNSGDKATLSPEHTSLLVNGGFARFDEAETAVTPTDETR